jgi:hypothetical protein
MAGRAAITVKVSVKRVSMDTENINTFEVAGAVQLQQQPPHIPVDAAAALLRVAVQ